MLFVSNLTLIIRNVVMIKKLGMDFLYIHALLM